MTSGWVSEIKLQRELNEAGIARGLRESKPSRPILGGDVFLNIVGIGKLGVDMIESVKEFSPELKSLALIDGERLEQ